jgi:dTDP-4-amino-4,6-dideoxygalactose transaminase
LISNFEPYRELPSAAFDNLPEANKIGERILCLPIYVELSIEEVEIITNTIKQ